MFAFPPSASRAHVTRLAALLLVTLGVAACGGDGRNDEEEIARVIKLHFSTPDEERFCDELTTPRLVKLVYGGRAQCHDVARHTGSDSNDVEVSRVNVVAGTATARIRLRPDDFTGTVEVREVGGRWRLDGYGTDLLRPLIRVALESTFENRKLASKRDQESCLTKITAGLSDDRVRQFGYPIIGERVTAEGFGRPLGHMLGLCIGLVGHPEQSYLRALLEDEMTRDVPLVPAEARECAVRKLRGRLHPDDTYTPKGEFRLTDAQEREFQAAVTACVASGSP